MLSRTTHSLGVIDVMVILQPPPPLLPSTTVICSTYLSLPAHWLWLSIFLPSILSVSLCLSLSHTHTYIRIDTEVIREQMQWSALLLSLILFK